jgi:hypothetical protein
MPNIGMVSMLDAETFWRLIPVPKVRLNYENIIEESELF